MDVTIVPSGAMMDIKFRIPTKSGLPRIMHLTFDGQRIRDVDSGSEQPTATRGDLKIPDLTGHTS